jgi:hypothetical protein
MPEGAVYVGRPTIWGNPFIHEDPAAAALAYEQLICREKTFEMGPGKLQFARNAHPNTTLFAYPEYVHKHIGKLTGKDLVCWCALDKPCHADVLLKLADERMGHD